LASGVSSAASDQNATTASWSRESSTDRAATVAAAMRAFSPRMEPETSTTSTTARRDRIRSRTTMSVSSGTGRSASTSIVRSRSMSSDR
jgi:hypothetical protein